MKDTSQEQAWLEKHRRELDETCRAGCVRMRNELLSDRWRLAEYPAFELIIAGIPQSKEDKKKAWLSRWTEAGNRVDWLEASPAFVDGRKKLRMIAMATSPIWAELGKMGMGSAKIDAPPFLPGSVWTWEQIEAETLLRLKLMDQQTLDAYVEMHTEPHQFTEGEREIMAALESLSPEELAELERELETKEAVK